MIFNPKRPYIREPYKRAPLCIRELVIFLPMKFPKSQICSSEFPLTQSKSTYLNASSSIRDHRARVITVKVGIDDLSADLGDDPQKRRHFEDKLIRSEAILQLLLPSEFLALKHESRILGYSSK